MNTGSLSIIIPAYNEAIRLPRTLEALTKDVSHRTIIKEILIVDDGSTDDTAAVAARYAAKLPVRSVRFPHNQGKGAAVRHGMREAAGEFHMYMDADNAVAFEDHIDEAFARVTRGADVVIGSIRVPGAAVFEDDPRTYRRLLGDAAKYLIMWTVLPGIHDTQRGFKVFSKAASRAVFARQRCEGYGFDIEILAIARAHNFSIDEMPVTWRNDAASKVRLSDYVRALQDLARVRRRVRKGEYRTPIDG